jgi:hypothetical protein
VLCQLSYGPRLRHSRRPLDSALVARETRRPLGVLFLLLAAAFLGVAYAAARAGGAAWVIAVVAALIGVWLGEQALRALR